MLKKCTALLMMFSAYAILLGHAIIPHHHHDTEHEAIEHHQTHHHNEGDEDDEDLSHILTHYIHSADGFTFNTNPNYSISKQLLSLVAVLPYNFSLDKFLIPPLLHKPPAEHLIYISPHSLSSGLRAPPPFSLA